MIIKKLIQNIAKSVVTIQILSEPSFKFYKLDSIAEATMLIWWSQLKSLRILDNQDITTLQCMSEWCAESEETIFDVSDFVSTQQHSNETDACQSTFMFWIVINTAQSADTADTDQFITSLEIAAQCKDDKENKDKKIQSDVKECCDTFSDLLENEEFLRMNCTE